MRADVELDLILGITSDYAEGLGCSVYGPFTLAQCMGFPERFPVSYQMMGTGYVLAASSVLGVDATLTMDWL